jgi:hypothetical protein
MWIYMLTSMPIFRDSGHEAPLQEVKQRYVQLLGVGDIVDVAVTPSTSYALSLVAASIRLRPGQQVCSICVYLRGVRGIGLTRDDHHPCTPEGNPFEVMLEQVVVLEAQSASNVMQWQACVARHPDSHFCVVGRPSDDLPGLFPGLDAFLHHGSCF